MKAKLDKVQNGRKKIVGLVTQLNGRIRGSSRSRKLVYTWGKQGQQDRLRRIDYSAGAVNTRYGTLGVKIQCAIRKLTKSSSSHILKNLQTRVTTNNNNRLIKDTLRSHIKSFINK